MYDLIIMGAGPAGLTAALYAGRYRLNTLVLEKIALGGQIMLAPTIENFPGFPGGISTQELMERFKKQIDDLGIKIVIEEVESIIASFKLKNPVYNIKTKTNSYETKSIIIASGAQPRPLGAKGENRFIGRGVSYCGTCDGPFFKDKDIVLVGGGDRAAEETIFLSGYARKIFLVHRREAFRASQILVDRIKQNPKINFILDSVVEEIIGKDKVETVSIKNLKTNATQELPCQGIFIFVGIRPNTDFLKKQLEMDEAGFIITDEEMKTSYEGVFACGDCRKKSLYQVITACGEGAVAAFSAQHYLLKQ